ncbi:WbqC family protein [Paenibacillus graminis]|uniref:WbqC-like protein n=1 Tax=Paenibacillus graminis TaxID=189425 RepID=A0A089MEH5_9BACL|nr:WbqC family protein [Paenibacillus graminis]AIQ71707.1 WbqC-like protein [Paenibacillus graminis]
MKIGIMQPYFLPYLGYFQLINEVDLFVIYDNIQYTKKGWVNRNRYLAQGKDHYFTINLKKESDFLDIRERHISEAFNSTKCINQLKQAYKKAPYYEEIIALVEKCFTYNSRNLFEFIHHSVHIIVSYLGIDTKIVKSSSLDIDSSLKSQDRVIAICKALNGTEYINPIGGVDLYSKDVFSKYDLDLKFICMEPLQYEQFGNEFIPALSIIDVLMFNSREQVIGILKRCQIN